MLKIPTLKTHRLTMSPISMAHSLGMFELWADDYVCKYSGKVEDYEGHLIETPVKSYLQSDLIIDFWQKAILDEWGFRWAVLLEGQFVGIVGFNSLKGAYEIAYHLLPQYWGKGIMTEASLKAIEWAKSDGCQEIEAFIEPKNVGSFAVAQRLNMLSTDEYSDGAQRWIISL